MGIVDDQVWDFIYLVVENDFQEWKNTQNPVVELDRNMHDDIRVFIQHLNAD